MKHLAFLLFILLFNNNPIVAQDIENARKYTNHEDFLALEGFDPVSYFKDNPTKGEKKYTAEYAGIRYQFKNQNNLDLFKKSPQKYIPVFGGWCAYAMAYSGKLVPVDPETYKIIDGKLYLFYNQYFNNTLKKWNKNEPIYLRQSHKNWEAYLMKL